MTNVFQMLFDLDGTLIDSKTDLANSINLMLTDLGRPILDEAVVGSFVGDGVRVLVRRCLTATHHDHEAPDEELHKRGLALMLEHYSDEMLKTTKLYPHVDETLEYFKGKRKAVVTSKEVRFTKILLEQFGIAEHFNAIVGGDTVKARKPDPEPVLEAIRQLGGLARQTVMIGDSENDINAGRGAATFTCGVTFGFRNAEQLRLVQPDFLIDSFDQLKEIFF
jgi:phosphoglycolate phosphatase